MGKGGGDAKMVGNVVGGKGAGDGGVRGKQEGGDDGPGEKGEKGSGGVGVKGGGEDGKEKGQDVERKQEAPVAADGPGLVIHDDD
jgi:hypothetical protein